MSASALLLSTIIVITQSLDCSQYQDINSCPTSTYCTWVQSGCRCAAPINLDILFTISTSSYIGKDNFDNTIRPWLKQITGYGINTALPVRVGWDIFSSTSKLQNIDITTRNQMSDYIDAIYYDGGVADLSVALQDTLQTFASSPYTSQKINIIIMGTNPYRQGTTSAEVCQYASRIKQMGM